MRSTAHYRSSSKIPIRPQAITRPIALRIGRQRRQRRLWQREVRREHNTSTWPMPRLVGGASPTWHVPRLVSGASPVCCDMWGRQQSGWREWRGGKADAEGLQGGLQLRCCRGDGDVTTVAKASTASPPNQQHRSHVCHAVRMPTTSILRTPSPRHHLRPKKDWLPPPARCPLDCDHHCVLHPGTARLRHRCYPPPDPPHLTYRSCVKRNEIRYFSPRHQKCHVFAKKGKRTFQTL